MARTKLAPDVMQELACRVLEVQVQENGIKFGPPLLSKLKHMSRTLGLPLQTLIDFTYQYIEELLNGTFKGVDGVEESKK